MSENDLHKISDGRARFVLHSVSFAMAALLYVVASVSHAAGHDSGQVFGRVFFDLDDSGDWSQGDEAAAAARILTDRGLEIITGSDGRYHLSNVLAGRELRDGRVLVLDRSSLPSDTVVVGGCRKLLHLPPSGLPVRADFLLQHRKVDFAKLQGASIGHTRAGGALNPRPDGQVETLLTGTVPNGCMASMDGEAVRLGKNREYSVRVKVKQGISQHLLSLRCQDGKAYFFLARVHRISRVKGGDLVLATRPMKLCSCSGPSWDGVPKTSQIELTCVVQKGVELFVQGHPGGHETSDDESVLRYEVLVKPGANDVPVILRLPDGTSFFDSFAWKVIKQHLVGTLYGVAALGLDASTMYMGGHLGGFLEWSLPQDAKLLFGGGLDSFDMEGQSLKDALARTIEPRVDERRFQRDPDPEQSWTEHADDSVVHDVNADGSRYFLQVTRKGSSLGWGAYTTGEQDMGQIGRWSRALDGGHGVLRPLEDFIDKKILDLKLEGFWSPAMETRSGMHSSGAHDEFLATGGTLYFLGHAMVRQGSERVMVQRRDASTGMVLTSRRLSRGVEYQVDWQSGRVMLTEPLDPGFVGALNITPSGMQESVLVVDYEYLLASDGENRGDCLGGSVQVSTQPVKGLEIGGRFDALSSGDGADGYNLMSSEVSLLLGEHSRVWARWANSAGLALKPSYSVDGGITLLGSIIPHGSQGEAYEAGASLDYSHFSSRVLFRRYLAGYSDTSFLSHDDMNQGWAIFSARFADGLRLRGSAGGVRIWDGDLLDGALGLKWDVLDTLDLLFQAVYEGSFAADSSVDDSFEELFGQGQGFLLGAKATWRVNRSFSLFAAHRQSVWSSGSGRPGRDFSMSMVGLKLALWSDVFLGIDAGWGPDTGTVIGLGLNSSDDGHKSVFAHTTVSVDSSGLSGGWFTGGQNGVSENGWIVSSTQTMQDLHSTQSIGQKTGIQFPLTRNLHLKLAYERSELHRAADDELRRDMYLAPFLGHGIILSRPSRRNAVFGRIGWIGKTLLLSAAAEYRSDERLPVRDLRQLKTLPAQSIHQTVLRFATRWAPVDGFALTARLAWAETMEATDESQSVGSPSGGFIEGSLGAAWRPENIDWLRFFFRALVTRDQRPGQFTNSQPESGQETYFGSSLAAAFYPSKYFQPTLVVAPWYSTFDFNDEHESIHDAGLMGMLRVGCEIWAGLGVAAELRTSAGKKDFQTLVETDDAWRVGLASEIFYSIRADDIGAVRLSLGYSLSDIPDPLMTELMPSGQGMFFRLEGML